MLAGCVAPAAALLGNALSRRPRPPSAPVPLVGPRHVSARRTVRVAAFQEAAAPPPAKAKPAAPNKEVDHVPLVKEELKAKKKVLIAQTAPAVRIAIGEELGLGPGVNATGKMVRLRAGAVGGRAQAHLGPRCCACATC